MNVRFVRPEDCPALLAIYARYIHTDITFEYELPSEEEFSRRIAAFSGAYPYLVLEENSVVRGYAHAYTRHAPFAPPREIPQDRTYRPYCSAEQDGAYEC